MSSTVHIEDIEEKRKLKSKILSQNSLNVSMRMPHENMRKIFYHATLRSFLIHKHKFVIGKKKSSFSFNRVGVTVMNENFVTSLKLAMWWKNRKCENRDIFFMGFIIAKEGNSHNGKISMKNLFHFPLVIVIYISIIETR